MSGADIADFHSGNAADGNAGGLKTSGHHRISSDGYVVGNGDRTENLGTGTDVNMVAQLRIAAFMTADVDPDMKAAVPPNSGMRADHARTGMY